MSLTRHVIGSAASLAAAVGVAACASMAPHYERPAPPVPQTYPTATAEAAATPAAAVDWRDYFVDPRLQALIALSLANNRDLRGAVLRVEEARAAYRIRRADGLPIVAAGGAGVRGRVPDLNITGQPLEPELVAAGAAVNSWELDFWGRVRSLKDAALEEYLATDAARRAATLSLITQVANSYLTLRELDDRLALARRAVANRQESLRIFRRRVDVGATSRLVLTQVEVLWQQARALVTELELARDTQAHALDLLVGAPANLSPAAEWPGEAAMFRELQPGLPSELLTRRPDIVATEHALKAANANIGAARAAFFPNITLTGALGLASADLDGLFSPDNYAWLFVPTISLPIFDGGRRRAALDVTEVRRQQAVVHYEQAVQAAFRDVSDALSARHWLDEELQTLNASVAVETERARLARLRYDTGAASYLEVLDAERERLSVEQQLAQTRRALASSRVALYAALGGGSQTGSAGP